MIEHPNSPAAVPPITGRTDVYLILGDPVEQVLAPQVYNALFARHGVDAVLVPARVPPAQLERFVQGVLQAPNIRGLWVTIPHKAPCARLAERCDDWGRIAGAVNALRRDADGCLAGALLDGQGFVAALDRDGIAWRGRHLLVIGAGGAGSAIGASLACAAEPAASLAFYDPAPGLADALAQRLARHSRCSVRVATGSDPAGYDLVINASPLGLHAADPLPCEPARLGPHAAVVDILMKNQPTPFVRAARQAGLVAQPGFEMLIQQVPLYLDFFGFPSVARAVREDDAFVRELLAPAAASA
jgi:shikimate dehydrogenase